jgi:hypothetical protein
VIIAGEYSFKNGATYVHKHWPALLDEVYRVIKKVDASQCKTKTSKEKTMPGRMLYNPRTLNRAFKDQFYRRGWQSLKVQCDYPKQCIGSASIGKSGLGG